MRRWLVRWSSLHLLAGLLAIPFVVGQNAWFEWANTLWLLQLQTGHVAAHGIPTYFIHEPGQFFYPINVFYAGPTLSVLAYPAAVLGAWPVFAATTVAAFVAASAGVGWAARSLGVPPELALIPGLLFATTPYLVSDLYGRGAWSELISCRGCHGCPGSRHEPPGASDRAARRHSTRARHRDGCRRWDS